MRAWMTMIGGLAGLFGAAGVALSAIGAHLASVPNVTVAANFLLVHAGALAALCAVAAIAARPAGVLAAASLIATGVALFSGELTLHALADVTSLGRAAPIGGSLTILGWLIAAAVLPLALRNLAKLR